jgi:TolA-binding protein
MRSADVTAEEVGRRAAAALEAYSLERDTAIASAHRRLLGAALRRPEGAVRDRRYIMAAVATAATLFALAVGFFATRPPSPLTFTADGRDGALQVWVAAPGARAVPLEFSDGTSIRLQPSARARVVAIDDRGASIALENGALQVSVVHRPQSAWRVIAGPLTLQVTGTVFEVSWLAVREVLRVSVSHGSVAVSGPGVGHQRPVEAGETLEVLVGEGRLELTKGNEPSREVPDAKVPETMHEEAPPEHDATRPPVAAEAKPQPAMTTHRPAPTSEAPADDWRALARRGLLRQAFAAAESSGFEAVCQEASAAELLTLGDGARLSGKVGQAQQALVTLRRRYPSDPRSAAAAFALGKVAFDLTRSYARAAHWFMTCVREQPGGSLAREASGRRVEALQRSGDAAAARRAAQEYLARYPDGPHANVARSVLR